MFITAVGHLLFIIVLLAPTDGSDRGVLLDDEAVPVAGHWTETVPVPHDQGDIAVR